MVNPYKKQLTYVHANLFEKPFLHKYDQFDLHNYI